MWESGGLHNKHIRSGKRVETQTQFALCKGIFFLVFFFFKSEGQLGKIRFEAACGASHVVSNCESNSNDGGGN